MAKKEKALIQKLHESLIKEFRKQLRESINDIPKAAAGNITDIRERSSGLTPELTEAPSPREEDHCAPAKIIDIRNEVAATQSTRTAKTPAPLNPDKQRELMEIVKQRSEEFERELRRTSSVDNNTIESAAQRFKDELMDTVRKQLTKKKHILAD